MSKELSYERYQRQMILPGFGIRGQQLLANARVLVVGAGGLGCPALQYLAAAGVGLIGIADGDQVALSNLHRQVLFTTTDIGYNKAEVAAKKLQQLNPDIEIKIFPTNLNNQNIVELLPEFDMVVDGTDNFATRYMINDACVLFQKTLVYGAVSRYEGQVAVFNHPVNGSTRSANYRDLFPEPPKDGAILNCADAGVLGVLPGIIGAMQAAEVIKLITGTEKALVNQLLTFQIQTGQTYLLKVIAKPETASLIPSTPKAFQEMNYEWLCSSPAEPLEIQASTFDVLVRQEKVDVIDVRELHEIPVVQEFNHHRIPLANVKEAVDQLKNDTVVVFCQSGKRSLQAAKDLSVLFGDTKKVYSLQGGILSWKAWVEMK